MTRLWLMKQFEAQPGKLLGDGTVRQRSHSELRCLRQRPSVSAPLSMHRTQDPGPAAAFFAR